MNKITNWLNEGSKLADHYARPFHCRVGYIQNKYRILKATGESICKNGS